MAHEPCNCPQELVQIEKWCKLLSLGHSPQERTCKLFWGGSRGDLLVYNGPFQADPLHSYQSMDKQWFIIDINYKPITAFTSSLLGSIHHPGISGTFSLADFSTNDSDIKIARSTDFEDTSGYFCGITLLSNTSSSYMMHTYKL